jgi:signal transduction histidine kinase
VASKTSIPGYRAGFFFVICLLAAVSSFTLYAELRNNEKIDALVSHALARQELIGRIRLNALHLENPVDDHIRGNDDERAEADAQMVAILDEIGASSEAYTKDLPSGERALWKEFTDTCEALASQVRKAVGFSNRKQSERARQHLVEKIRPVTWALDEIAEQLSAQNAAETHALLRNLEELRFRTTAIGSLVALLAVILAIAVGFSVARLVKKQERTIHRQMDELDRRNQELDAFASRVAHDLVSPLAPLKGYLTLIRRSGAVSSDSALEMLKRAEESAARMGELVEALLRFCRAGTPSDAAAAELDTAVTTLLLEVGQAAAHCGVSLERQLEPRVRVACSAQLLQSIAQNILSNAVKYTAGCANPKVVVRVAKESSTAVLEVADNGRGMSEETQRALFQPFFRAPETRTLPGHGLGMATTKRLVEAHGGALHVHSELNVGTRVTVRLPLAAVSPSAGERKSRAATFAEDSTCLPPASSL